MNKIIDNYELTFIGLIGVNLLAFLLFGYHDNIIVSFFIMILWLVIEVINIKNNA